MSSPTHTNEFDAAKQIVDILKTVEKSKCEQVLRWASESVGLNPASATPAFITSRGEPVVNGGSSSTGGPTPPPWATDIKSFIAAKNPRSDVHFSAAVAYYHRFVAPSNDRKDVITAEILQESGRQSGRGVFPRPDIPLSNAVKQGYLDRAGGGQFKLNAVGENLVAMTLPGGNNDSARKRPSKKRANPQKRKR